MNALKH